MRNIAVCDVDLGCRWPDFFFDMVCFANYFCCVCVCVVLGMESSNSATNLYVEGGETTIGITFVCPRSFGHGKDILLLTGIRDLGVLKLCCHFG